MTDGRKKYEQAAHDAGEAQRDPQTAWYEADKQSRYQRWAHGRWLHASHRAKDQTHRAHRKLKENRDGEGSESNAA